LEGVICTLGIFAGKVVIVTGSGAGIGRAEALLLASEGASVVVNDIGTATDGQGFDCRTADRVVSEIADAGGAAAASYDDVTSWAGAEALVNLAYERFGALDSLVCNAGVTRHGPIWELSEADWDTIVRVNLKGTFCPIRFAVDRWRNEVSRAGSSSARSIVTTTSGAGLWGQAQKVNYSAAKMGVAGLTMTLARELVDLGVRANAISPVARTRLMRVSTGKFNPAAIEAGIFQPPEEGQLDLLA
jgi:NAD(P)-dependent dehydrogenase (short-subunit alcohol dehydrogenase family)